jgi:hypothetical protein
MVMVQVQYCCVEHQRRHRIQHKAACKAAVRACAQAAEAASAPGAGAASTLASRPSPTSDPASYTCIHDLPRHLLSRIFAKLLSTSHAHAATSRFWPLSIPDPEDSGPKDLMRLLGHDTSPKPLFSGLYQASMTHPSGTRSQHADAALGRFDAVRDANSGARAVVRLAHVCKRWHSILRSNAVLRHVAVDGRSGHHLDVSDQPVSKDAAEALSLPPNLQTLVLSRWAPRKFALRRKCASSRSG